MEELKYIVVLPLSVLIFMLSGWKGNLSGLRTWVLAPFFGAYAYFMGTNIWECLFLAGLMGAAFSVPYGSALVKVAKKIKVSIWALRLGVMGIYSYSTIPLGVTPWQWVTALVLWVVFLLSNVKWAEKVVVWKVWESLAGLLIGVTVCQLLP